MPQEVSTELGRVVERWQQLALDLALSRAPRVRAVVEALADQGVPDRGPGVLMDQLTVMVYDTCRDAVRTGCSWSGVADAFQGGSTEPAAYLAERLAELRRTL